MSLRTMFIHVITCRLIDRHIAGANMPVGKLQVQPCNHAIWTQPFLAVFAVPQPKNAFKILSHCQTMLLIKQEQHRTALSLRAPQCEPPLPAAQCVSSQCPLMAWAWQRSNSYCHARRSERGKSQCQDVPMQQIMKIDWIRLKWWKHVKNMWRYVKNISLHPKAISMKSWQKKHMRSVKLMHFHCRAGVWKAKC